MCGISGCIVKDNPEFATNVYFNLLKFSDIRGQDGTGLTILRNYEFIDFKWNKRAKAIEKFPEFEIGDKVIGQNRYAIFGLDSSNNQPLISEDFALIHNGVLYNYEEQFKRLEEFYRRTEAKPFRRILKVDTELILRLMENNFIPHYAKETIKKVMNSFEGEGACLALFNKATTPSFIAFMKNKILYKGEDKYGNIYFFSTLRIKSKVPEICNNIKEFKNEEIEIY